MNRYAADIDEIESCDMCDRIATPSEPLIRVWGDNDEPDVYCADCHAES